jgi:hypothetical protein
MAVLSGIGGILFWFSFRQLDAEDAALDNHESVLSKDVM